MKVYEVWTLYLYRVDCYQRYNDNNNGTSTQQQQQTFVSNISTTNQQIGIPARDVLYYGVGYRNIKYERRICFWWIVLVVTITDRNDNKKLATFVFDNSTINQKIENPLVQHVYYVVIYRSMKLQDYISIRWIVINGISNVNSNNNNQPYLQ